MKSIQFILLSGFFLFFSLTSFTQSQQDFSGVWAYEVRNTPYGDFFGKIHLNKEGKSYNGKIVNKAGTHFKLEVLEIQKDSLYIQSDIEETDTILSCYFKGDSIYAVADVTGDSFTYKLQGRKED